MRICLCIILWSTRPFTRRIVKRRETVIRIKLKRLATLIQLWSLWSEQTLDRVYFIFQVLFQSFKFLLELRSNVVSTCMPLYVKRGLETIEFCHESDVWTKQKQKMWFSFFDPPFSLWRAGPHRRPCLHILPTCLCFLKKDHVVKKLTCIIYIGHSLYVDIIH